MRYAAAIALLVLASLAVFANAESHGRILRFIETDEIDSAVSEMLSIKQADPDRYAANNYGYLLARAYAAKGDSANAMAAFEEVAASESPLREYALWHLSQLARFSGDLMLERLYLEELLANYPNSLLLRAASGRVGRGYFESGNYSLAASELRSPSLGRKGRPGKSDEITRLDLALLAEAAFYMGDRDAARTMFERLVRETPQPERPDDIALEGVRGLDSLDGGVGEGGRSMAGITPEEHFRRAAVYQFNREFVAARSHYLAIVYSFPDHRLASQAAYQIGRGFAQEEVFAEAVPWFERVLEQSPNEEIAKDALLQAASAYSRIGKFREAVSRYRRYIDRYPNDERLDRAYLNIIDVSRDAGADTAALRQAAETQEIFRGRTAEAQALFAEARIYISGEKWNPALEALERLALLPDLGGSRVPGGTDADEVSFLRAFTLEQLQRSTDAVNAYLSIQDGRGAYYGWLATERLRSMGKSQVSAEAVAAKRTELASRFTSRDADERRRAIQAAIRLTPSEEERRPLLNALTETYNAAGEYASVPAFQAAPLGRTEVLERSKRTSQPNRHKVLADELIFLGLFDEAGPELEASGAFTEPAERYALAVVYTRGGLAYRGVRFLEPAWDFVPADYQVELLPREAVELLFPVPYRSEIRKAAEPRVVDPRLLLSIMRQESRYDPDAKSVAAARGLMQFIPQTAGEIAQELNIPDYHRDDVYDPETAILFGSQYLGDLLRLFPNEPAAATAAYNSGEANVKRWKKRAASALPERYVPEIMYSQTKDYVRKVMANYRVYSVFYDPKLDRLPSLR